MQAALIFLKIKERINKLDSSDYDNLQCWQAREAFNKAQLEWVRRQIAGKNQTQDGDEETRRRIDDLQILLKPRKLNGGNKKDHFESEILPSDYLYFKRVTPIVRKGKCISESIVSKLREEANVDDLLINYSTQPSFDFEQTFHTIAGNKIKVYTLGDFLVEYLDLIYYRKPRELDFTNCEHIDGKTGNQTDPEFKDDIVELIIDDTVSILAGDTENVNQFEINKQRSELNT